MANKKGLGVSRKFADGTVHENGTGRFIILNRFEGEDGAPWLEFQWLSGEKEGQAETNKEMNMNASIHKFNTIRKAAGEVPVKHETTHVPQTNLSIVERGRRDLYNVEKK